VWHQLSRWTGGSLLDRVDRRRPCSVEIASEYRYRDSVPNSDALILTISRSGETADRIAALQHARVLGQQRTFAVCNVPESALVRQAQLRFLTHAGPEIGVASTKAFPTRLAALFVLTLVLAKLRGRLPPEMESSQLQSLRYLPAALSSVLQLEPEIERWAQRSTTTHHAFFLGRGMHIPSRW